jgi:hypothetical protein
LFIATGEKEKREPAVFAKKKLKAKMESIRKVIS